MLCVVVHQQPKQIDCHHHITNDLPSMQCVSERCSKQQRLINALLTSPKCSGKKAGNEVGIQQTQRTPYCHLASKHFRHLKAQESQPHRHGLIPAENEHLHQPAHPEAERADEHPHNLQVVRTGIVSANEE
jgi:hypothetical protein